MSVVESWHRVCDRLRALGDRIAAEPFGTSDQSVLEGFEHLVDQMVLWFGWETLHADPARPFFHRHNDLVSQWGGPNADNVYRHCRIDPARRYVVRGRMHSCDEFVLAVRAGFMHRPRWGTLVQVTASDRGIGPGHEFELFFGGDAAGAIALPDGAVMLSVREYYFEWTADEPATFVVECLDPEPAGRLGVAEFETRLDESLCEMEESIDYWNAYLDDNRALRRDNDFTLDTVQVSKGLSMARYEFCFWDLAPEQALLIECDQPDARYWSLQLYTMHTFEPVDVFGAITSRNHTQVCPGPDGRVRVVVSARDPGVANWLDTCDHTNGLCTLRWFWPSGDARPAVSSRVVPVTAVADELVGDQPLVSERERAGELAARQSHLRWRFRT